MWEGEIKERGREERGSEEAKAMENMVVSQKVTEVIGRLV